MNLKDLILNILHENSGGIKFTELISKIMASEYEKKVNNLEYIEEINSEVFPEILERACKETPGVGVLEYVYPELRRIKLFVYFINKEA